MKLWIFCFNNFLSNHFSTLYGEGSKPRIHKSQLLQRAAQEVKGEQTDNGK